MFTALLMSSALQWLIIVAMAMVIFALVRQVGVLHERLAPAGALMKARTVRPGDQGPQFQLPSLSGSEPAHIGKADGQTSTLLFFLAPGCPICKELLPAVRSLARQERDLHLVLASDGEELAHRRFIEREGLGEYPYVLSTQLGLAYGVDRLPYAVLLDAQGRIAGMGLVNSREHLDSLLEARDLRVSSLQEYLQRRGAA